MKTLKSLALLTAAVLAFEGPASAQIGKGDAPIEIRSKTSECLQKQGICVWTGEVVAVQADSRMTADKLTLVCNRPAQPINGEQSCDEIKELIAESNVIYTMPDGKIRGDKATYNYSADTITVTGDVISSQGDEGVVRGTEMVYNVAEGRLRITAGNSRVLSIITPTKKKDPAAQPGPGPAPGQVPGRPATATPSPPG